MVEADELLAFIGMEGDCEDWDAEAEGSEGCDGIVGGVAAVLVLVLRLSALGLGFALFRGPIVVGRRCRGKEDFGVVPG